MFQFGRPVQTIDVYALVAGLFGFGVQKKKLKLGADLHVDPHVRCAFDLPDQHMARIDGDGGVIHPFGARETHRDTWLPGQGDGFGHGDHVEIGKAGVEADIGRIPNVAGHIH